MRKYNQSIFLRSWYITVVNVQYSINTPGRKIMIAQSYNCLTSVMVAQKYHPSNYHCEATPVGRRIAERLERRAVELLWSYCGTENKKFDPR